MWYEIIYAAQLYTDSNLDQSGRFKRKKKAKIFSKFELSWF